MFYNFAAKLYLSRSFRQSIIKCRSNLSVKVIKPRPRSVSTRKQTYTLMIKFLIYSISQGHLKVRVNAYEVDLQAVDLLLMIILVYKTKGVGVGPDQIRSD